jgi:hypothetical protein
MFAKLVKNGLSLIAPGMWAAVYSNFAAIEFRNLEEEFPDDVEIERLASRACFFAAVEDGNLLYRGGQGGGEVFDRERAIEADFEQTDVFAAGCQGVNGFMRSFGA